MNGDTDLTAVVWNSHLPLFVRQSTRKILERAGAQLESLGERFSAFLHFVLFSESVNGVAKTIAPTGGRVASTDRSRHDLASTFLARACATLMNLWLEHPYVIHQHRCRKNRVRLRIAIEMPADGEIQNHDEGFAEH